MGSLLSRASCMRMEKSWTAMFACLYLSLASRVDGHSPHSPQLVTLAKDFSPRVEVHDERTVTLDISGLGSLLGDARAIGDELVRTAEDRGLRLHIAIASTRMAAILLAHARPGLTIIPPGGEAAALAPLPIGVIGVSGRKLPFESWGLRTL